MVFGTVILRYVVDFNFVLLDQLYHIISISANVGKSICLCIQERDLAKFSRFVFDL